MFDPLGLTSRFRRMVETALPWFDRAEEDRQRTLSRTVRLRAERVIALRNGYDEYGARVQR